MKPLEPIIDHSPARCEYLERTVKALNGNLARASEIISLNGRDLTRLAEENERLKTLVHDLLIELNQHCPEGIGPNECQRLLVVCREAKAALAGRDSKG